MADVERKARLALAKHDPQGEPTKNPKRKRATLPAAVRALRSAEWDCLRYNERTTELVFSSKPPCDTAHRDFPVALVDADFTAIVCAFDRDNMAVGFETVVKAAVRAGTFRSFDPVRDYLDALKWDDTERLPWWLENYFGAGVDLEDDEEAQAQEAKWNQEIGRRWMIAAVARVFDPGCQVDSILIAEGPQGTGKSSAFRALAVCDEWFATDLPDIRGKDAVHHVLGPWLIELDELDALNRREATSVKSYVSRRTDRARLSYDRLSTNHPRRIVFCGTTNEDAYNTDATGGRRFWPFKVRGAIDVAGIVADRDQLWAEAVVQYKAGTRWHLDDESLEEIAQAEQRKRFKPSPWLDDVEGFLTDVSERPEKERREVSVTDVLDFLDIPTAQRSQYHVNEAVRCLQHLGWIRRQVRRGDKRPRLYFPPIDNK